jgi:hypothetical protein
MTDDATVFDSVKWHPNEWRFYTEGTVIAWDDLGACTSRAMRDGWYYVESSGLGNVNISYMPPEFDPAWIGQK